MSILILSKDDFEQFLVSTNSLYDYLITLSSCNPIGDDDVMSFFKHHNDLCFLGYLGSFDCVFLRKNNFILYGLVRDLNLDPFSANGEYGFVLSEYESAFGHSRLDRISDMQGIKSYFLNVILPHFDLL